MLWRIFLFWHLPKIWWHNQLMILFDDWFNLALLDTCRQHARHDQSQQQYNFFHFIPPAFTMVISLHLSSFRQIQTVALIPVFLAPDDAKLPFCRRLLFHQQRR